MQGAIAEYKKLQISSRVESASPQELIQMLFEGLHGRLASAQGCLDRADEVGMRSALASAVGIIEGLQASLDLQEGGELAGNLHRLYAYAMRRLWQCNVKPELPIILEVGDLLRTVSDAWATLGEELAAEA